MTHQQILQHIKITTKIILMSQIWFLKMKCNFNDSNSVLRFVTKNILTWITFGGENLLGVMGQGCCSTWETLLGSMGKT